MNATRLGALQPARLYVSTTHTHDPRHDLDYIAIERAINGEPTPLTLREKLAAAQHLDARGYTPTAIAALIGSTHSSITQWKAQGWTTTAIRDEPAGTDSPDCGTPRGYAQHRRRREDACPRCKRANADRSARYKATGSTLPAAA
ncbi:hypothetical protein [Streptomyces wuyuanensis]|uniref:hypothetical protein n=1 Tax=Streptomyces wuyuanensis TaxID=1196353 RepID=UPI00341D019F